MTCFSFIFRRSSRRKVKFGGAPGLENVKLYSYKELQSATGNFNPANKVGEGGFGCVYKGRLKDGKFVAIKVLSPESRQGVQQFLNELATISNVVHENLVSLDGCCVEGDQRILVYSYLENNSLAKTLLGQSGVEFSWTTRKRICIGVSLGLAFLHEEVQPRIVHRDIKASNILLDKDLTPKISDFGLAKLLPADVSHISTRVAGTIGYLAPEYAIRGQVTRKADIYSFGVLLLEIIAGRNHTDTSLPYEDQFLLEKVWVLYEHGNLESIIDASLNGDFDSAEACNFLKIGLFCTQDSAKCRPAMSTVVKMLTGEIDVNSLDITRPGMITDFMDLKVRRNNLHVASNVLSPLETSPLSSDTYAPSHKLTFILRKKRGDCAARVGLRRATERGWPMQATSGAMEWGWLLRSDGALKVGLCKPAYPG